MSVSGACTGKKKWPRTSGVMIIPERNEETYNVFKQWGDDPWWLAQTEFLK